MNDVQLDLSVSKTDNTSLPQKTSFLRETIQFILLTLLIVMPIRWFVAQPFIVSGASMENTFHSGEYLIVDQLSYHIKEPKAGDVIIFRYPLDPSTFFIKRIIGIPGDTVVIEGDQITIKNSEYPEGYVLEEPYIDNMNSVTKMSQTLDQGEYFVMGDNRDHSSDSRTWGVLKRDYIVGRAYLRLFPFNEIDHLPGEYSGATLNVNN